jgi:hypothetical protein
MSLLTHKDPRYTLPALVYVAVLATAWIATLGQRRLRRVLSAGLVLNAAVLFAGMTFGLGGGPVRFGLAPSPATLIYPSQLTLYETSGWIRGGPTRDGAVLSLQRGMHRYGIRSVSVDTGADGIDFNFPGIQALAMMTGLQVTETRRASSGTGAFLFVHRTRSHDPSPCQTLLGGEGIYVAVGEVAGMGPTVRHLSPRRRLICP